MQSQVDDARITTNETRSLESPAVPLWSPSAYDYLVNKRSTSGVPVNRQTVLGLPAFWRGVNLLASKIARLPLSTYKRNKDGGREPDVEHDAYRLLMRRPNSLYSPFVIKQTWMGQALIHGNSYTYIFRDNFGAAEELVILAPEYTYPVMEKARLYYITRVEGTERKLLPENVLHFKGLSHDGLVGHSIIDTLREPLGHSLAQERYSATWFRNNGSPGPTILKFPHKLDDEKRKQFREQWRKMHEGLDNSHKVAILEGGLDIVNFDIDNESAQLIESRQFGLIDISNVLGIPPHKLGASVNTNYNSLESEERAFLNDTLDAWLTMIEEECEAKLLTDNQLLRENRFIEFDRRSLEQADYRTRSESMVNEVNNGLRSLNEVRAMLNLPSVEDGDRFRIPTNLTFTDMIGTEKDQPATDEPSPNVEVAPAVEGDSDEKQPLGGGGAGTQTPDAVRPDAVRLHDLTTSVVKRQLTRLGKALEHRNGSSVPDTLRKHRGAVIEALKPLTPHASGIVDDLFDTLTLEAEAVLPEQLPAVIERINTKQLVEHLIYGTTICQ